MNIGMKITLLIEKFSRQMKMEDFAYYTQQ